ncbi:hypothetical protein DL96DRAFT_1822640 [Flagelloscypha sp. PMI_526]|nr:hypothetical protein DL96DRAFT_1822640 [Flagelloscypha sp. PMI_526]
MASLFLLPSKTEAKVRLHQSAFALVLLSIATFLLPTPTLLYAFAHIFLGYDSSRGRHIATVYDDDDIPQPRDSGLNTFLCWAEVALASVFILSMIQGAYGLQYSAPSHAPPPKKGQPSLFTPVKQTSSGFLDSSPGRPFAISPNSVPQVQRPFSSSISMSSTPNSTPSKILHYSTPPLTSSVTSTSTMSTPSPSPLVSAFRSQRTTADLSSPLDATYLSELKRSMASSVSSFEGSGGVSGI